MITLDDMIREAKREINMRRAVYPRSVAAGKLRQEEADMRIARMVAIEKTLERLLQERDATA